MPKCDKHLRENAQKYRDLVEATSDFVWEVDAQGRYTYCSPQIKELLGVNPTEMLGRTPFEMMPPDDQGKAKKFFEQIIAAPKRFKGFVTSSFDSEGRRLIFIDASGAPFFDKDGRLLGFRGISRDITERKKAEEQIESISRFPLENPYAVLRVSQDFKILYSNPASLQISKFINVKIGSSCPKSWRSHIKESLLANKQIEFEENYEQKIFSFKIAPIATEGYVNVYGANITERKTAEAKVQALNERFEMAQHAARVGVWDWDIKTGHLEWTAEMFRLFGLNPKKDSATFETWNSALHREDKEKANVKINTAINKHAFLDNEYRVVHPNGKIVWINALGQAEYDDRNNPIRMTGICIDITARKGTEEKLRYNKERLELISSIANQLLSTIKPQSLVQTICNKVMEFLGCTVFFNFMVDDQKQQLHLNAYAGVSAETAKTIEWLNFGEAVCGCAAQEGRSIVCKHVQETDDPRAELVRSFGVKAYAANPLLSEGKVVGTLSFGSKQKPTFTEDELALMKTVAAQVSIALEHKRAQETLNKLNLELEERVRKRTEQVSNERQRLYNVLDTLPAYVVLLDKDYHAQFANKVFRARFGESHGRRCYEFLFKRNLPCENCETFKVMKTNSPHRWEWAGPDGREYDVYDFPFIEIDGANLILEMGIDITERKLAEKIAQESALKLKDSERLAAIGATAGMVGHDIRNPLQAITSDVYLAKGELAALPISQERTNALESMDEIENNVDYINKIVQDLQDYARPLNPVAEESDLEQIVEKLIAKNGLPKNITISVKVAADARKISADSYYINRILYNLVTNSVQAMPKGGRLTIRAFKELGDYVITVKDTGVGIPKDIQSKMFTPMFTTKSKGQGFGLPVVKRMTESLGGSVTFDTQQGKGTTFIVRLPQKLNGN